MSFSARNNAVKSMQSQVWYKGKIGFIAFVTLISIIVISGLWGFSLYVQKPHTNSLPNNHPFHFVNFTCAWARIGDPNKTFTVTINVDLTDGMNLDEAIRVATTVFNVTMGQNKLHGLRFADEDENGIWKIEFGWEYATVTPLYFGHWFEAIINPSNQTVVYDRCK